MLFTAARSFSAALLPALLWTLSGIGIGLLLRYQLIQPTAIGSLCSATGAPAWCPVRQAIITFSLGHSGWGITGFCLLSLSLFLDGIASRRLLALALLCGGITAPLYAAASGAIVLLGGWLRHFYILDLPITHHDNKRNLSVN